MKLKNTPHDIFYYLVISLSTLVIIAQIIALIGNLFI
jgi:hypothetical protein